MHVRIGSSDITEVDNVHIHREHVFAQLLQHETKNSWDKCKDNAYWWWAMASTSGVLQITRYEVGSGKHRGSTTRKIQIRWYVKAFAFLSQPSYSQFRAA